MAHHIFPDKSTILDNLLARHSTDRIVGDAESWGWEGGGGSYQKVAVGRKEQPDWPSPLLCHAPAVLLRRGGGVDLPLMYGFRNSAFQPSPFSPSRAFVCAPLLRSSTRSARQQLPNSMLQCHRDSHFCFSMFCHLAYHTPSMNLYHLHHGAGTSNKIGGRGVSLNTTLSHTCS